MEGEEMNFTKIARQPVTFKKYFAHFIKTLTDYIMIIADFITFSLKYRQCYAQYPTNIAQYSM